MSASLTCFFCGDVMTGRGIDQILPHPGSPDLYEGFVRDARDYVALAESHHGTIERPASFEYPWGQALEELARFQPEVRLINLETSITPRGSPWPGKGIHYRMHPANALVLKAAGINACSLANNHLLDWGREGLSDTLARLDELGVAHAGAGESNSDARRPMVLTPVPGHRVLIWCLGLEDSGIPSEWEARSGQAGIWYFDDASELTSQIVCQAVEAAKRPGDLALISIHWGGNWGYRIPSEHRRMARQLVDAGADLIHGHSSHHPKGFELYKNRPIFYGCGDLINDYEGITGHEVFRPELTLMYFCQFALGSGALQAFWMTPLRMERFSLLPVTVEEAQWLEHRLNRERHSGTPPLHLDGVGHLRWLGPVEKV